METWDEMNKRHIAEQKNLKNLQDKETQEAQDAGESDLRLQMLERRQAYETDAIHTRQVYEAKEHADWEKGLENGPSINMYLTEQERLNMELNDMAQWQREQQGLKGNVSIEQLMEKSPNESIMEKKSIMDELRELFEKRKPGSQEIEP